MERTTSAAVKHAEVTFSGDPRDISALIGRINVELARGRHDRWFPGDNSLKLNLSFEPLSKTGVNISAQGDPSAVAQVFSKLHEIMRNDAEATGEAPRFPSTKITLTDENAFILLALLQGAKALPAPPNPEPPPASLVAARAKAIPGSGMQDATVTVGVRVDANYASFATLNAITAGVMKSHFGYDSGVSITERLLRGEISGKQARNELDALEAAYSSRTRRGEEQPAPKAREMRLPK